MKKLFIPQGIKLEKEVFKGFNQKRANVLITIIVINFIFSILVGMMFTNIIGIGIFVAVSFIAFGLLQKGESNMSAYDIFKQQSKFRKSQKKYYYKYKGELWSKS